MRGSRVLDLAKLRFSDGEIAGKFCCIDILLR